MAKRFRILEITEWDINRPLVQANADHNGDYNAEYFDACKEREFCEQNGGENLPWEVVAETKEDALEKYREKFYTSQFKLAIPVDADMEGWKIQEEKKHRKFTVSLQVDTRIEVEVYADSAEEAGELAKDADFEMKDLEFIESHLVNAYDVENDKLIDLC